MKILKELRDRWKAKTPAIFSGIIKIAVAVSAAAMSIQTALVTSGAEIPVWWSSVFPYLIGTGAGAAAVAKLTREKVED